MRFAAFFVSAFLVSLLPGSEASWAARTLVRKAAPGQLAKDTRALAIPPSTVPPEPRAKLPRLVGTEEWNPAPGKPWATEFTFDAPQYAINEQAPSWIALYERQPKGSRYRILKSFRTDALRGSDRVEWPKVDARKEYRVQGTLYFCQGFDPKVPCVMQSLDHVVKPSAGGEKAPKPVTITYVALKTRPTPRKETRSP